jgi:hypothetical protein
MVAALSHRILAVHGQDFGPLEKASTATRPSRPFPPSPPKPVRGQIHSKYPLIPRSTTGRLGVGSRQASSHRAHAM